MKVYHGIDEFVPPQFPIVTTGTFDGVHCGHLEIINRLKKLAEQHNGETVLVSFHPHPRVVIHPEINTKLILTIDEKIERLSKAGINHFIIIPFTKDFSRISSLSFVRDILIEKLNTKVLVIGYDHQFGHNRKGTARNLKEYSLSLNFEIEQIPAQTFKHINISSTKIRDALVNGDITTSNRYLGYSFFLTGKVVHGYKMGKVIGFPTANIEIGNPNKIIPANGVYAVYVRVDRKCFGGMLNIGSKPTLNKAGRRTIEVHIFDFNSEIYGKTISIHFQKRIRSEEKFIGIKELRNQLKKDKVKAIKILMI